jgi:fatty acid/phospholipid biosynthesis enzyme
MSEISTPSGYKIALDCMGGDLGPSEAVAAAALAIRDGVIGPEDTIILVGHEDNLRLLAIIASVSQSASNLKMRPASSNLTMQQ